MMNTSRQPVTRRKTTLAAVLFDWDGTLSDSRRALLDSWQESTQAVLGRRYPADPDEEDVVFTQPGSRIWPSIARDDEQAAELATVFQSAYERNAESVRAFPGVLEMLASVRATGIATAVVTSKARRRYEPDAVRIGLASEIDVAVCAEEARPKPDPAGLLEALRRVGVQPTRAAMVGDTVVDITAARRAGVTPIGVEWGHGQSDALLAAGARALAHTPLHLERILTESRI